MKHSKHFIVVIVVIKPGGTRTVFLSQVLADCSVRWWLGFCSPCVATSCCSEPCWHMEPWVFSSELLWHLRGGCFLLQQAAECSFSFLKNNFLILDIAVAPRCGSAGGVVWCKCYLFLRGECSWAIGHFQSSEFVYFWSDLFLSSCLYTTPLSSAAALISFPLTEIQHHQFRCTYYIAFPLTKI